MSSRCLPSARSASIHASVAARIRSSSLVTSAAAHGSSETSSRRSSPDESECVLEQHGGFSRWRLGRSPDELVEPVDVGLARLDAKLVTALAGDDPPLAEQLAETGDVDLDALRGRLRRSARPDLVDEAIRRDCPASIEQE